MGAEPHASALWEGQLAGVGTASGQISSSGVWPSGNLKYAKISGLVPSLTANGTSTAVTLFGTGTRGPLTVPLTAQQLIPSGVTGVTGADRPFTMGVPIPDSAGITSASSLSLSGTTAVPAGNIAVDNGSTITVATAAAKFTIKKANFNVLDSVVVGSTTLLGTSSSSTRGLVLMGPDPTATFPANVTCGTGTGKSPCTTRYSSANDASSTCAIEDNGPVMSCVKCIGTHKDASGHPYMQFTTRMYFYQNSAGVKVDIVLRNANYDISTTPSPDAGGSTFNTAFKAVGSYELHLSPAITGTLTYKMAVDPTKGNRGVVTGTLNQSGGTDFAYVYQGGTNLNAGFGVSSPDCAVSTTCANSYTTDKGYVAYKNGTSLASGGTSVGVGGWLDCSDSSGAGLQIGIEQMAAYFPKSLECDAGGADMRIGIYPSMNGSPTTGPGTGTFHDYVPWTSWDITTVFLNFHATAPSSLANDFNKFQYPVVVRPSFTYVNSTAMAPYPIVDPTVESNYYLNLAQTANPAVNPALMCFGWTGSGACVPTPDYSTSNPDGLNFGIVRKWDISQGGQRNQEEWRWNNLMKFFQQGMTGRLLYDRYFYRFQASRFIPHTDGVNSSDSTVNGFHWKDRPTGTEVNLYTGYPLSMCGGDTGGGCPQMTNGDKSFVVWEPNQLHHHIHGIIDYCRIMADQTMCEAITPLVDFHHLTVAGVYGAGIARQIGIDLSTSAHLIDWFGSIGDTTNKVVVEAHALDLFDVAVKADTCLSGFPVGCTPPPVGGTGSPEDTNGVSKVRGQPTGSRGQFCPSSTSDEMYRIGQFFETSMLIDGTYHFAWQKGPSWNEYNIATDNVYGMSQADLTELYGWDGTTRWKLGTVGSYYGNGSRYELALDISTNCGTTVAGGTATLLGTTVTRASGPVFDATYVGRTFFVDANGATISAVNVGAQTLTISRNLGTYSRPVFYQTNPTGHATASGTSFVLADGPSFDNSWVGSYISIGGFTKVKVDAFNDASHLTLHSGVGTISTPTNYLLNAEQSGTYLYVLGLSDGTHRDAQNTIQSNAGTIWSNFWGIYQNNHTISDWRTKFDISLIWGGQGVSSWLPDYGSYKVGALISVINANSNLALQDVSFTITDNGTGHYHVGLTPRAGSTKLRIKYSPTSSRAIAPSTGILGYNTDSQTFAIDPTTHVSWFGANAMSEPAPTPGVAMSIPVDTGGIMGLTNPGNWSVKELAPKVSGGVADLVLGGKVSVSGRQ